MLKLKWDHILCLHKTSGLFSSAREAALCGAALAF